MDYLSPVLEGQGSIPDRYDITIMVDWVLKNQLSIYLSIYLCIQTSMLDFLLLFVIAISWQAVGFVLSPRYSGLLPLLSGTLKIQIGFQIL